MSEWVFPALLFVLVAGLSFVAISWANLRRLRTNPRVDDAEVDLGTLPGTGTGSAPEIRLDKGSRTEFVLVKDSKPDFVLGEMTPALAQQIPTSQEDIKKLQPELVAAGFYSKIALTQYLAIRATLTIVPLILAGLLALLVERDRVVHVLFGGLALSVLGFAMPRVYINFLARDRRRQIEIGLPVAVDLLTLGITSGQNILLAFQRVAKELQFSYPVLANELALVYRQASLNTLAHALEQFADRVQVPEIRNLAMILTQSERLGTDVATALLEFASNFRTTLRQRADAHANRAVFWMLFPTLLCLWIPAAVVVAGPIFFEFADKNRQRQEMKDRFNNDEMTKAFAPKNN